MTGQLAQRNGDGTVPFPEICATIDAWLQGQGLRDLALARRVVRQGLFDAGVSDVVADAVALVPRHPFVAPQQWRLAHTLELDFPVLPSPLCAARTFDALRLGRGEYLVLHEQAVGWTTIVGGALAAATGARAATTASPAPNQAALEVVIRTLGVQHSISLHATEANAVAVMQPCLKAPPEVIACLTPAGRAVWRTSGAPEAERLRRLHRRGDGWRLTDLGPVH